jgi:hypothetical protein
MTISDQEARLILAQELRNRDGDGVNMRLCIAYVSGQPEGAEASQHDKRKLDASLAAISRVVSILTGK